MMELSIVIPTCNRASMLQRSIAAVCNGTGCSFELIVVDGASTDRTGLMLAAAQRKLGKRLQVIREERREGFTKGINKGFRAARGRYVTWINDDARPLPGGLDNAVRQLDASPPSVGLLAMFHHVQTTWNVAYTTIRNGTEYKLLHVRGTLYANFGVGRRELFEELGYFDERYYVKGCDPDFSLKVWNAGLRVMPAYQSLIDHDETEDDRREADSARGREDNEKLFKKWRLPPRNPKANDFDPMRPCTVEGLRESAVVAA